MRSCCVSLFLTIANVGSSKLSLCSAPEILSSSFLFLGLIAIYITGVKVLTASNSIGVFGSAIVLPVLSPSTLAIAAISPASNVDCSICVFPRIVKKISCFF